MDQVYSNLTQAASGTDDPAHPGLIVSHIVFRWFRQHPTDSSQRLSESHEMQRHLGKIWTFITDGVCLPTYYHHDLLTPLASQTLTLITNSFQRTTPTRTQKTLDNDCLV
jgi:hypothetical protein